MILHFFTQYYSDKKLDGFPLIRVDDFIPIGSDRFTNSISEPLQETFLIGKQSDTDFKYIGVNILQKKVLRYLRRLHKFY